MIFSKLSSVRCELAQTRTQTEISEFKSESSRSDEDSKSDQQFDQNQNDDQAPGSVPLHIRNHRYRNSIEFPQFALLGNQFEDSEPQRIRFPSFESNPDTYRQYLMKTENEYEELPVDRTLYNEVSFDLEADAKQLLSNTRIFSESERKTYFGLICNRNKGVPIVNKSESIAKYKLKKARRKMTYKIRYKVRQDLAIKRLRNKGKFIKSKKLDLRAAANLILNGPLNRG